MKMLFGHSEPDIQKLPSEMPRTRTDHNLGEKASITLKGSSKFETLGFYPMPTECGTWMTPVYRVSREKRTKVFGSSQTHHGGFVASSSGDESGTHVTAVIAVSASGRKTPPFFIEQGK